MKKIIGFALCISTLHICFAQNDAILTYEDNYSDKLGTGKVTTIIYESQNKARVESTNAQTASAIGTPNTASQNILIYDFTAQKETHLIASQNRAVVMPFLIVTTENRMMSMMGTDYVVQTIGTETVSGYHCTHYVMTTTSSKNKNFPPSKKEIWITNDLGKGNLYFISPYLYIPLGSYQATKLASAGGTGIVVKWQITDPISNQPHVCTLVNYQPGKPRKDVFTPPSNYTVAEH